MKDWKGLVSQHQAQLTAYGVLFEALMATLIAKHPERDELLASVRELQTASAAQPSGAVLSTLCRRLLDHVQQLE